MMRIHDKFKVHVYDRTKSSNLWPLASANNIPVDGKAAQQYFVHAKFNNRKNFVSVI
jgi:hypothetical protein